MLTSLTPYRLAKPAHEEVGGWRYLITDHSSSSTVSANQETKEDAVDGN